MGLAIRGHLVLIGGEEGGGVFDARTSKPVRRYFVAITAPLGRFANRS